MTFDPFLAGMAILSSQRALPERIPLSNAAAAEALDTLLGSGKVRGGILGGQTLLQIHAGLQSELNDYLKKRREFLIYPE